MWKKWGIKRISQSLLSEQSSELDNKTREINALLEGYEASSRLEEQVEEIVKRRAKEEADKLIDKEKRAEIIIAFMMILIMLCFVFVALVLTRFHENMAVVSVATISLGSLVTALTVAIVNLHRGR